MNKRAYIILFISIIFIPLGLLTKSAAWGEWSNEHYIEVLGYLPKGIANGQILTPILKGYSLKGNNIIFWYYMSATIAIAFIFLFIFIVSKILKKKNVD